MSEGCHPGVDTVDRARFVGVGWSGNRGWVALRFSILKGKEEGREGGKGVEKGEGGKGVEEREGEGGFFG